MKLIKWMFILFGIVTIGFVLWIIIDQMIDRSYEARFYNIKTPSDLKIEKPNDAITNEILNSINLSIKADTLIVTGTGYGGYNFYYWHKPKETGEIYIRAFEITQNIELSKEKLFEETQKVVQVTDKEYHFFKSNSLIYEGTFEKYYPTRFELWFRSEKSNKLEKLTESKYLIDGWDR